MSEEIFELRCNLLCGIDNDLSERSTVHRISVGALQPLNIEEFLLPVKELYEQLGSPSPGEDDISDDDIEDIAEQYDVSPILVRTVLVNQGILPREVLAAAR